MTEDNVDQVESVESVTVDESQAVQSVETVPGPVVEEAPAISPLDGFAPSVDRAQPSVEVHSLLDRLESEVDSLKSAPHAMAEWVKTIVAEIRAKL